MAPTQAEREKIKIYLDAISKKLKIDGKIGHGDVLVLKKILKQHGKYLPGNTRSKIANIVKKNEIYLLKTKYKTKLNATREGVTAGVKREKTTRIGKRTATNKGTRRIYKPKVR